MRPSNPDAQFRAPRCKSSEATIAKALTGEWKEEYLFVLKQSLQLFDFYTTQIAACDTAIRQQFSAMKPRWQTSADEPVSPISSPRQRRKSKSKNEPPEENRDEIIRLTGVDLAIVGGIGVSLAQTILSEIGTDMSKWPTDKHFTSWLGLAPHNDVSGGRVIRSRTLPTYNRAGQAFRQAATSVSRGPTAFGAYYRRKRAQGGPMFAQVVTAHKIARTVYHLLKYRVQYEELGAEGFASKQRERDIKALRRKAANLGFTLNEVQPIQPTA